MVDLTALLADLDAEQASLDGVLAGLDPAQWDSATPAPGWTVRHQVAHLAYFDRAAQVAVSDPEAFAPLRAQADADPQAYGDEALVPYLALDGESLLGRWRDGRAGLAQAFLDAPAGTRVPWYGPAMSVASMVTARLMETWAHGQDVVDAVGATRTPTARLGHVARIACLARPYSYLVRGLQPPTDAVRVELSAPDGGTWTFGPEPARDRVTGGLEEFCLVLTRRRHVADTRLRAEGPLAQEWLDIGQAYAGDPGPGRQPGDFTPATS